MSERTASLATRRINCYAKPALVANAAAAAAAAAADAAHAVLFGPLTIYYQVYRK